MVSILDTIFKSKQINDAPSETVLTLKDVIAPAALKIEHGNINVSGSAARTFFIISYPRAINDSWLSPLVNWDKVFDLSMFIYPIDSGDILKKFERKVAEVESQIMQRSESGRVRDPQLEQAYQDLENLRDSLIRSDEKMFDVGIYITLYGRDSKELDKVETEMRSMFESRSIFMKSAIFQQAEAFTSTLPLGKDLIGVHTKLNTSPLSASFPFLSFDLTQEKGIMYGIYSIVMP
jgi:hypothetical protein